MTTMASRALGRASRLGLALAAALSTGACSFSIHQLYVGSMDPGAAYGRGRWVEAEGKKFVILGFEFDSDYVDHAYKELESKCAGRLAQVTTEHLTAYYFLSFEQRVYLKGMCVG
jgi:hypothetical protein